MMKSILATHKDKSSCNVHNLYARCRGDIVWLNFTAQTGHEQAGRRPAVVLSPQSYNHKTGLLVCVPITSQIKGYPFEVEIFGAEISGAALADQVKSLDWRSRQAQYKSKISEEEMRNIKAKIAALLALK